jgi:hypothetical protein
MTWRVRTAREFDEWYLGLSDALAIRAVNDGVDYLRLEGPNAKRPVVGEITGSTLSSLKELRPLGTIVRILFAFDPERAAILLLGGDKERQWSSWYDKNISSAERLYRDYMRAMKDRGER